ncbi:hypothetical protein F5Y09DRAFT_349406 [Xylaria sp. FL1042]|nr:hypothetical protein F5Y09DRAFT_349406 [Xylaria sp. FL1042]
MIVGWCRIILGEVASGGFGFCGEVRAVRTRLPLNSSDAFLFLVALYLCFLAPRWSTQALGQHVDEDGDPCNPQDRDVVYQRVCVIMFSTEPTTPPRRLDAGMEGK